MYDKGFLSYVSKLEKISLGEAQREFLYIIAREPISAYDIHLQIKKQIDIKNVRKTVTRLHRLGLIEIEGYYPRKAIRFRITSYGLFQLLCDGPMPISILDKYKDDIILRNILFDSFELETIKEWMNLKAPFLLMVYVRKCYQAILTSIQNLRSPSKKKVLDKKTRSENFVFSLTTSLSREFNDLIIEILINTVRPVDEFGAASDWIPKVALARDKKFRAMASSIKEVFLEGCDYYMI